MSTALRLDAGSYTPAADPGPKPWYPDDILTIAQVAARLQVAVSTLEKMDLPVIYCGGRRTRRLVWGQVVESLRERAR
jgi:hypothetical protein